MITIRFFLSFTTVLLLFSISSAAQLFEDFEQGSKGGYAGASVTLSTGSWFFDEALLGGLDNDMRNGSKSVRMLEGNIYMQFDKQGGADELSFVFANYGSATGGKLQVQYSIDQGSSWTNIGDEYTAKSSLETVIIPVNIDGAVRFKFVQSGGNDRLNLDDVLITDFITAATEADINVSLNEKPVLNNNRIEFGLTSESNTISKKLEIRNLGTPNLEISDVTVNGDGFLVSELQKSTLAFKEITTITVSFTPDNQGEFSGVVTITNNSANSPVFTINLSGEAFTEGVVMPISEARILTKGTRVTVAGRVSAANQLGETLFIQDKTAGIAIVWEPLQQVVEIGDSIKVTGPLGVISSTSLIQISETGSDNNIIYEVFDVPVKNVEPKVVSVQQLNTDEYQGQLVVVQNVSIESGSVFQAGVYELIDLSEETELRIDSKTNLIGTQIPSQSVNLIGIASKSDEKVQLLPRFVEDIGMGEASYPGDEISKDLTLEVVTWNVEWFGDTGKGPEDDDLQLQNVVNVVKTIDADIYALQEIASPVRFAQLVENLDDYGGFLSSFSQTQETAFLFKRSAIDSLSGITLSSGDGFTRSNWANGRYPLLFNFVANIGGEQQEFYMYNIHAKATFNDPPSDYNQRLEASAELKEYLDINFSDKNVIVLGDYNDEVLKSVVNDNNSPYKNFDDDGEYSIITKNLETKGYPSQSSFGSFLDHITITSELSDEYLAGSERVEIPNYIGNYLSTTSDHYPIWTRFKFAITTSNDEETIALPRTITLNQNYPNPFNPSTIISYKLDSPTRVTLNVYDITGRKVATLVDRKQTSGTKEVSFDASSLASGVYIYRLQTAKESSLVKKMVLIK